MEPLFWRFNEVEIWGQVAVFVVLSLPWCYMLYLGFLRLFDRLFPPKSKG